MHNRHTDVYTYHTNLVIEELTRFLLTWAVTSNTIMFKLHHGIK